MKKDKILFVGAFLTLVESKVKGGQIYACNTLINSNLSKEFEWYTVDTTATSNTSYNIIYRLVKSVKRLIQYCGYLFFIRPKYVLIFSSNSASFMEKGLMAIIAKKSVKTKVIFAPRSGMILKDFANSDFAKFGRLVFRNCDIIICQSNFWRNYFYDFCNCDITKLIVVKNWIEIVNYPIVKKDDNIINILFLGWIETNKGIYDIITAIDNLELEIRNKVKFNIAGRGKDEIAIRKLVKEKVWQEQVTFHGWVSAKEKDLLIGLTDIFVLTSYFEGLPNSLLECMSNEIACITTNVGSIGDVITHMKNGILIVPGDSDSLTNYLHLLITNDKIRRKIGIEAKKYIQSEHSLDLAIERFRNEIFTSL